MEHKRILQELKEVLPSILLVLLLKVLILLPGH